MGVDVRVHLTFLLLLLGAMAYGAAATDSAMRGLGLFVALFFAVAVRETARCLTALYAGLRLRALFLFPVGGVMAFAPQEPGIKATTLPLLWSAPLANLLVGLLMMGLSYATSPGVNLVSQPWISPTHVLRSFIWMQFVVGVVNLLPTAALPTRQLFRGNTKTPPAPVARIGGPAFSLITGLSAAMLLAGLLTANIWVIVLGAFLLLLSQLQTPAAAAESAGGERMAVSEVMLTEFITLSSSDTLRGALVRTVHSLQDVFPVVRGDRLVGSVTRQTLADHLQIEGDGYVQGVMTRSLQIAAPTEQLVSALRRAGAQGASEFIPVAEQGRVLGILTPQSLTRAVHQVKQTRPPVEAREPR